MFFSRLKNFVRGMFAALAAFGLLLAVWSMGATAFPQVQGERTYYLRSQSSQALIKNRLSPLDFSLMEGESVSFSYTDILEVEKLMQDFQAQVLFTENVGGTTSYYCYSPHMRSGVRLGEHFVNLHIAVRGDRCAVGSPMIFGGF